MHASMRVCIARVWIYKANGQNLKVQGRDEQASKQTNSQQACAFPNGEATSIVQNGRHCDHTIRVIFVRNRK